MRILLKYINVPENDRPFPEWQKCYRYEDTWVSLIKSSTFLIELGTVFIFVSLLCNFSFKDWIFRFIWIIVSSCLYIFRYAFTLSFRTVFLPTCLFFGGTAAKSFDCKWIALGNNNYHSENATECPWTFPKWPFTKWRFQINARFAYTAAILNTTWLCQ